MENQRGKSKLPRGSMSYIMTACFFILIIIMGRLINIRWAGIITPIAAMVIFVIVLYVSVSRNYKRTNNIINLLNEDCNPYAFMEAWEEYDKAKGATNLEHLNARINIALGHFYTGDFKRGISGLTAAEQDNTRNKNYQVSYVVFYNLAYIYLFDDQLDKARQYIDRLRQLVMEQKLAGRKNSHEIEGYHKSILVLEKMMDIKENHLDGVLEFFQKNFSEGANRITLVCTRYQMFLIYEKLQELDGQYECMKYIKENGGQLFLAKLADDWLKNR